MAKTRAQRKAEQRRRREAQRAHQGDGVSEAQHRTQVPESADVIEAELAEQGVDIVDLAAGPPDGATEAPEAPEEPPAPAPSRADVGRPRGRLRSRAKEEPTATATVEEEEEVEAVEEPGDRISRRARKQQERERRRRAKESAERRQRREPAQERQRGRVIAFFISCWAELKRVQWPDRETLIQASAVTVLFIAIAAAYLGTLDTIFNFLVQHLL